MLDAELIHRRALPMRGRVPRCRWTRHRRAGLRRIGAGRRLQVRSAAGWLRHRYSIAEVALALVRRCAWRGRASWRRGVMRPGWLRVLLLPLPVPLSVVRRRLREAVGKVAEI